MNVLRLCALSVLLGIAAASVFAQQAPSYSRGSTTSDYAKKTDEDPKTQQPGHPCNTDALLAENARLKKQVELLKGGVRGRPGHSDAFLAENTRLTKHVEALERKVKILEARIRTLGGSR